MFRIAVLLVSVSVVSMAVAQSSQQTTADVRNDSLRTLNSYFPYRPPKTRQQHQDRTSNLRAHLKVALGLWPEPTKTPLNTVIHSRMDRDGFTIEKVYFESFPGFFVTGNLYKPQGIQGRRAPGVLCPHGHHRDGRFRRASEQEIDAQIAKGAETFRNNARSPLQARCAHLAKMGCIVFHYDMLGYADSQQIGYQIAHGFSKQRPAMNSADAWGLFSPQAESHFQSVMGLQTWNSIRALDFLVSHPEVDKSRIGVTGASGGGTQTFILCAIDDRPQVAFPAVMVSTAMQGGCTCENCSYLRINMGNVDFASAFAPKPLGLTAADDWTREMKTKGFPELQQLYDMLGYPDRVQLTSRTEFEHNYNQVSREAMYRWFGKHLQLPGPVDESEIEFIEPGELTVYDADHPQPTGGDDLEKRILQIWTQDAQQQLARLIPSDENSLQNYAKTLRRPLQVMIGRQAAAKHYAFQIASQRNCDNNDRGHFRKAFEFRNSVGERFTATISGKNGTDPLVLLVDTRGSAILADDSAGHTIVEKIISAGFSVVVIDHIFIDDSNRSATRQVENHRDFAGYTLGYNSPQIIRRLHDYLGLISTGEKQFAKLRYLVSLDPRSAGLSALTAAAVPSGQLAGVAIDTHGFRFASICDLRSPNFLPGGAKYFDVPGYLSLSQTNRLLVLGESKESLAAVVAVRRVNNNLDQLEIGPDKSTGLETQIIQWLRQVDGRQTPDRH